MVIIWSARSLRKLDAIYDYHACENIRKAVDIYNSILDEVGRLRYSPRIGQQLHLPKKKREDYRGLVVKGGDYKVIYYIEKHIIHITQIWEYRRDPQEMDKELE